VIASVNKKLILILGIVFLLVLAGCKGGSSKGTSITDIDVRKGTDGLIIEFIKNAPPDKVFEDEVFPLAVRLKNEGASNIELGFLVFGFEKAYIDVEEENEARYDFSIDGKSIINLKGDEEFITVNTQAKQVGAQSETHPSTILATACYPYKTILGTSACVDTDILGLIKDKLCDVNKPLEFSNGQGAPVAVTRIETRMLPHLDQDKILPHFIIYVENKGNGEVINLDKVDTACTSEPLDYTDFNRIRITAKLADKELNCNIGDEVDVVELRLREKKDKVRCIFEEGIEINQDVFTTTLEVELEYGYTFTKSKDITIEKSLIY